MNFIELAAARHSVRKYEPGLTIDDAELQQLFNTVILSPSSYNVQHWQFVVVRDQARKTELSGLSFGQPQVADAAAVVLVCGRLDAFEDAPRIYADVDPEMREKSVGRILGAYTGAPALQREEAIRSGSLAAMSLMYAAKALGWDSGPMIGFEADKVSAFLNLDARTIPVMMIVVGKALNGEQPARAYRRPVAEVVKLETLDGASLGARSMTLAWYDWIGSLGVFLILLTYFLLQTDRIHAQAIPYSVMNLLGASFIAVSLLYDFNFSAFVIEICWIAISIVGIARILRRRRMELTGTRDQ